MQNNLLNTLIEVLKQDERFISNEWDLLKNTIREKAENLDENLISLLLDNETLREKFFIKIKEVIVFDNNKFIKFINNKEFLPDSYTSFKNKIGLTNEKGDFIASSNEVVLSFPFKDCVLAWWQDKDEQKRDEIFYNEILGQDDIDRLFDKKVFTNFKRIDKDWEHKLEWFNRDENGTISDNLIIKWNNLLALHSLKSNFASKVKLIYIDPPYNTWNDSFNYNDKFNHSTWLTFMKNRLEVAKELLRDDWVIFVQCDDNEQAYLKVLMDEIFWREGYLNTISVKTKASSWASWWWEDKKLKKNIEYITIYWRNNFEWFDWIYEETELIEYIKEMKENWTSFKYINVLYKKGEKEYFKTIKDWWWNDIKIYKVNNYEITTVKNIAKIEWISEKEVYEKYYDLVMTTTNAQTSIRTRVWENTDSENNLYSIEYIPVSWKNKWNITELLFLWKQKVLLIWLKDTSIKKWWQIFKREKIWTFWDWFSWINVQKEWSAELKNWKKPEHLIKQVLDCVTNPWDIVLDYHLWSGTTCAVAHKMWRQYIGIEQMDYIETISKERMKKVIEWEQWWISKNVEWSWWWEFVYMEIMKENQKFIDDIKKAKNIKNLFEIYNQIKDSEFINYKIDTWNLKFNNLSESNFEDFKLFLIEILDKNLLYKNYSERDDKNSWVNEENKKINNLFYNN